MRLRLSQPSLAGVGAGAELGNRDNMKYIKSIGLIISINKVLGGKIGNSKV